METDIEKGDSEVALEELEFENSQKGNDALRVRGLGDAASSRVFTCLSRSRNFPALTARPQLRTGLRRLFCPKPDGLRGGNAWRQLKRVNFQWQDHLRHWQLPHVRLSDTPGSMGF
jgi:hypothetical protein